MTEPGGGLGRMCRPRWSRARSSSRRRSGPRDQTVGALAIFAFLPQKKGITDLDRELFRLVSSQAAPALHGARLFQKESRRAATFEGLVDLIRPARRES